VFHISISGGLEICLEGVAGLINPFLSR